MPLNLELPNDFSYVMLAATSTFFVNIYHTYLTVHARKDAKIAYPQCYATQEQAEKDPAALKFNCAQRAHANFTENLTPVLGAMLISGLRYPVVAAALGAGWSVSRIVYAAGYTSSGPGGRRRGASGHFLTSISLLALAAFSSVMSVLGK